MSVKGRELAWLVWLPRPRFRFGMRSLLALMVLCCVGAKLGSHVTAHHSEQAALAEMRRSGIALQVDRPLDSGFPLTIFC